MTKIFKVKDMVVIKDRTTTPLMITQSRLCHDGVTVEYYVDTLGWRFGQYLEKVTKDRRQSFKSYPGVTPCDNITCHNYSKSRVSGCTWFSKPSKLSCDIYLERTL